MIKATVSLLLAIALLGSFPAAILTGIRWLPLAAAGAFFLALPFLTPRSRP